MLPKIGKEDALPKTVHTKRLLNPNLRREIRRRAEEIAAGAVQREDQVKLAADTLRRVILRGIPTDDEAHSILGILAAASKSMQGDE